MLAVRVRDKFRWGEGSDGCPVSRRLFWRIPSNLVEWTVETVSSRNEEIFDKAASSPFIYHFILGTIVSHTGI